MEVIVRNLPDGMTEKQIRRFFSPHLANVQVNTFKCNKFKRGGVATLIMFDRDAGLRFLQRHGQTQPGAAGYKYVVMKLSHQKRFINCMESKNAIDPLVLRNLQFEEEKRLESLTAKKPRTKTQRLEREFSIATLSCGQWCYDSRKLIFGSYYTETVNATMKFGKRSVMIKITAGATLFRQLEIPYASIASFTLGSPREPTVTLQLTEAPRFFEEEKLTEGVNEAVEALRTLQLSHNNSQNTQVKPRRRRMTNLGKLRPKVAATCLCYRFHLQHSYDYAGLQDLKRDPNIPTADFWIAPSVRQGSLTEALRRIQYAFSNPPYVKFSFRLKFHIQQLAQNGYLEPWKVEELMPIISRCLDRKSEDLVGKAVQRLSREIPFGGPQTDPEDLRMQGLADWLTVNMDSIERDEAYAAPQAKSYEEIALIYKALVTPVGIYLTGPEPEVKNRVLRKYSDYTDYFLSVNFADEDGEPLRHDRFADNHTIYHERFKNLLQDVITIAGRSYQFLGFSHSSLRAQTCWFMAPFIENGSLVVAGMVIKDLGDFSEIRSPAKCAARIGQAFSQAFSSVEVPEHRIKKDLYDVERNGRNFSDGVGTVSLSLLKKIWSQYAESKKLKPTVLQIRFGGAKGMISLDTRLEGDALCLRPSMIKFPSPSVNVEICGAGFKPLPMYLNRQLIKILEDLGVEPEAFMNLQNKAVDELRRITESPVNASSFLRRSKIGVAARLPWLVRELWQYKFSYADEDFLRNIVELATLIELREIKHRSRIKVDKGVTLYGIMDETGFLQEGQIYCTMHNDSGPFVLTGSVVITRCPALHPGDVQVVEAVDVPTESPLRALHNCIVFSQYGERDLPSRLSGGDLDGDLYNVIYDDTLFPTRISEAAAYPPIKPIDIGREVERSDMADFFIKFMENDSLGRIATLHQTLADHRDHGTFAADCLTLADLHSSAVDFSKSGVPADLSRMPRYPPVRPDFQAPGPRLLLNNMVKLQEDPNREDFEDDDDEVRDEYAPPRIRYYKSRKVLGQLYRAIDEEDFLMQLQGPTLASQYTQRRSLVDAVWKYVKAQTNLIQWSHWYQFALDTRDSYEENLIDTMFSYSPHAPHFVSEVEVFCGRIIGKDGAQNKRQREFSTSMKDKHERDVEYTIRCIQQGEEEDHQDEALERSIACLYVGCKIERPHKRVGTLVSFAWVAAAVCLREVKKFLKE